MTPLFLSVMIPGGDPANGTHTLTLPLPEVNTFCAERSVKKLAGHRRDGGTTLTEPRIPPRPTEDWDAEVEDALSALRPPGNTGAPAAPAQPRRERPSSNILGIFSWHPALAKGWFAFNNHLFHSTLTARDRELVTVRIAWLRRGEYEWAQHVRMAAAAGLSPEEVDAIMAGPDSPVWGARDAAVLRSVDEFANDHIVSDETWKRLAQDFDRQQLMDLMFTIGAYDVLAVAMNSFGLELDPGLPGFPPEG
jgi:alkylhydroperoxidase family enzyme